MKSHLQVEMIKSDKSSYKVEFLMVMFDKSVLITRKSIISAFKLLDLVIIFGSLRKEINIGLGW